MRNRILSILQLLIIPILYLVNYYSKRRMGFMRYLVSVNRRWENSFLTENFKFLLLFGAIAIIIYELFKFYKNKSCNISMIIFSLALVGVLEKFIILGVTTNIFLIAIIILIFFESIKKRPF
ncbi:MAG: hypothetical protein ACRCZ2_03580 [Fusobacteriaceae bacterium]